MIDNQEYLNLISSGSDPEVVISENKGGSEVCLRFNDNCVEISGLTNSYFLFRKSKEGKRNVSRKRGINKKTAKLIKNRARKHFSYLKRRYGGGFLFVTFTFPEHISNDERRKRVARFFRRNRNKWFYYVCVPELHKSGKIHYHALIWSKEKFFKRKISIVKVSLEVCGSVNGLDIKRVRGSKAILFYCLKYLGKEVLEKIESVFSGGNVFFTNLKLGESIKLDFKEVIDYIRKVFWFRYSFIFFNNEVGLAHIGFMGLVRYDSNLKKLFLIFAKRVYG